MSPDELQVIEYVGSVPGCQVSHDGRFVAVGEDFPDGGDGGGVRVFDTVGCCPHRDMIHASLSCSLLHDF